MFKTCPLDHYLTQSVEQENYTKVVVAEDAFVES
jgi:hypothetical protein